MEFKPFKIGKYVLLERLAMGGMAEVYRAKAGGAGGFEKQLAIKRILPNYSQNEEFRRMFEYEARLSSMLTHANIVQIYDFVKSGETYLLAMEYVDGKNLRQFINKVKKLGHQLPVEYGAFVINEVCKGLEYAHKKRDDVTGRPLNIIHRDMSPQNVMLSYDGAIKIVDFGIAKAKDRVDETRSGVIKGKFGYMSPEQANGEPVDHRTDIFSTGIILYELLTGRRLFSADNDMATLKLIQECVIPPPAKFNPKISPELEKIILKALTKDLNLRFQSAGAFNRQLQEFLAKNYPTFGQKDLAEAFSKVFKEEITQEKRRFEQIYRQSIPFSQGAQEEEESSPQGNNESSEGSITSGGGDEKTGETNDGLSAISENEKPEPTVVSGSYQLTENSEPERLATRVDDTKVEHVLDETSISTLGKDLSWNPEGQPQPSKSSRLNNPNDKTVIDDTTHHSEIITPTEESTEPRREPARPSTNTNNRKSSSGINLELDVSENNRRRERSISALNQVTDKRQPEIMRNLDFNEGAKSRGGGSLNQSFSPRRSEVADRVPLFDDEETPASRGIFPLVKTVLSLGVLVAVLMVTFSFYQSYLKGEIPVVFRPFFPKVAKNNPPKRLPSEQTPDPSPVPDSTRPTNTQDCSLKVESVPAGASVFVGNEDKGLTPTILPLACGGNFNITLKKAGYKGVSENIFLKKSTQSFLREMEKIPEGTLVLSVDLNATVKIEEIKYERYVRLNEQVEISLPAGKKFKIHFLNPVYEVDSYQEVLVQENERSERKFRLGDKK